MEDTMKLCKCGCGQEVLVAEYSGFGTCQESWRNRDEDTGKTQDIDTLVSTASPSQANDLWQAEREAMDAVRDSLDRYARLVYAEYTQVRGCSPEAALGVVGDRFDGLAMLAL